MNAARTVTRISLVSLLLALSAAPLVAQGSVSSGGGRGGGSRGGFTGGSRGGVGGAPAVSRGGLPPMTIGRSGSRGISSPGLPSLPPRARSQQPTRPGQPPRPTQTKAPRRGIYPQPERGRGAFYRGWGRRGRTAHGLPRGSGWWLSFPGYYPIYGGYQTPWVIEVSSAHITESSASHVITVPSNREPARPVSPKVYEVSPAEDGSPEGAVEMTPIGGDAAVEDEEMLILVALKDGTIYATADRWIEGDDLRFVGPAGAERIVALIDVDMRLSAQLNRERGAAFVLEAR